MIICKQYEKLFGIHASSFVFNPKTFEVENKNHSGTVLEVSFRNKKEFEKDFADKLNEFLDHVSMISESDEIKIFLSYKTVKAPSREFSKNAIRTRYARSKFVEDMVNIAICLVQEHAKSEK